MDSQSAKNLVIETFENGFDKAVFLNFIRNLVKKFDESKAFHARGHVKHKFKKTTPVIKTYERLGTYIDAEGKTTDILIVYLNKDNSIEARSSLRNFVADYLKQRDSKDSALVAFVSPNNDDWRFSLIKMEYQLETSTQGRLKATTKLTPAKRFSFLVGKNENSYTAKKQFLPLLTSDQPPLLSEFEAAFNVEKVTKEFFAKYRQLYEKLQESLDILVKSEEKIRNDFKEKNIDTVDFAKKLLGQIVFLYFLQKKGWFGVERDKDWGTGSKKFLRELFESGHGEYNNFFNDVLEHLFYQALRNDRSYDDHYFGKFDCKIPFLNGGLFDPINDYDWIKTDILLPNTLFSNNNPNKEGDIGDGILDIFDRYNFTVKEDEPLEKEVAIDPEMLGKVFENLLAVKDRKSKGSYYTPREIVHYMCQQSLINYLATELNSSEVELISRKDIETLIKYGETTVEHDKNLSEKEKTEEAFKLPKDVIKNAKLIDDKLADIRVCDPAVGSGAFLVGMMSEVVKARNALTNHLKNKGKRSPYIFKRQAIEKSLYGVDIDLGAVEIAKLRLWLSLIVDEENIKNIKPLPNLDYKIVRGNSLLSVDKQNLFINSNLELIENFKKDLFSETNVTKKNEFKRKIDLLINEITEDNKIFDFEIYFSEIFGNNKKNKGFDVVIANPPYLGEKGNKEIFQPIAQSSIGKRFYQRRMDLFYFFFHLALDIGKVNSQISFITTNYFVTADGAEKLRNDFKNRTIIRKMINLNELKIFEAAQGQHNLITILSKSSSLDSIALTCITHRSGFAKPEILGSILSWNDSETDYFEFPQKNLYDGIRSNIRLYGINNQNKDGKDAILNKIEQNNPILKTLCRVESGIQTSLDKVSQKHILKYPKLDLRKGVGVFIVSSRKKKRLIDDENNKYFYSWYKNSDISKYFTAKEKLNQEYILYIKDEGSKINLGQKLNDHFKKYKDILIDIKKNCFKNEWLRNIVEPWLERGNYYVLFYPRNKRNFLGEKIVAPYRSSSNVFGYNKNEWFASIDVTFITKKSENESLKYILAILNSKLTGFWLWFKGKRKGVILELYPKPLSEIPIKKISENEQKPFIEIVDKILEITATENYDPKNPPQEQKLLEAKIDQMVYKLYGLTQEEISIIEEKNGGA